MIRKAAVRAFLGRKRLDFRPWKTFSAAKLEEMMERLPARPPIWNKLQTHQKVCLLIAARLGAFFFLLDTGMGKTLLSLAIYLYFRRLGRVRRAIVLVPNKVNKYEWAREVRKHTKTVTIQVLSGSSENKWDQLLNSDTDLVCDTVMGLVRMVTQLAPRKKKEGNRLVPVPRLVRLLVKQFGALFFDESTLAKNKKKLPYRIVRQIAKHCVIKFALSGTPLGKDPTDLWSQFYLIDGGETLGETLGLFRAAFFTSKEMWHGGTEYTFKERMTPVLHRFIAHRSLRYIARKSDLPKLVTIVKEVGVSRDALEHYKAARDRLMQAHGNYHEMNSAFIRMRQISSGFIGYKDDDTGKRASFEFNDNPKLDLMLSYIEGLPRNRKFIIYHDFIYSGHMIARELKAMGVGIVRIYGKSKEDPSVVLDRFDNDPDVQGLVLNNAAGGFGLNLQTAQYGFRYEPAVGNILERQARRRYERQFSPHKTVFQYDFVVAGTYDERILDNHEAGRSLFAGIIDGV